MKENYHKEVEACMIDKFLNDLSLMCGESVVLSGVKHYLLSKDKVIVNLCTFTSD